MSLGLRLRIWMKKSGYTQQELAEITGVSRVSINNYINGNYEPKRDFFDKLRELGADVDYLLHGQSKSVTVSDKEPKETDTETDIRLRLLEIENKYLKEKVETYEKYLHLDKPKDYNFETIPAVAATPPNK